MSSNLEIQEKEDNNNLYESLHKKGVLDNIKAYLRTSLAQSIKGEKAGAASNSSKIQGANDLQINQNINNNLIRKTINNGDFERIKLYKIICSLVKDFFKKADLSYTFSVFTAECGFKDLLTEEEMSKILNISYSNLDNVGEENFLAFITKQLLSAKDKSSISTQASESDFNGFCETSEFSKFKGLSTSKAIEAKFKEVDEKYFKLTLLENGKNLSSSSNANMNFNYSNIFESLMPAKAIEEKMIKYQRQAEAKYKSDLDREILRMKEIEISNIRIEENKKYLKKLEEIRTEYEEEYSQRYENLRKREADFNLKIANKEKELELSQYETRQKYLNQIESLKLKQEELKLKYENDLNALSIKEEKMSIKEKDLENLRENANRKVHEEIENFKMEFLKSFEAEKAELHKQRLKGQEIEYKSNLRNEQFETLVKENKELIEESKKLKNEIKKLEEINKEFRSEIQALREELKILSANEKRNYDHANIRTAESESLRTENKILRENITSLKQMNEDRKNDQAIIIDDLKVQIKENTKQFNKIKEDLENENVSLRREVSDLKEKLKTSEKMLKNKEKAAKSENLDENLFYTNNVKFQQQLVNAQKGIRKPIANYEYNFDYLNLDRQHDKEDLRYNNYFKAPNKEGSKAFNELNKLEKEAEDLKQEFKNTFINKTNTNENNNISPVFNEYNLCNLQNKEAQSHTANLEKSIVNALFEKLKDANLFNNLNTKNNSNTNNNKNNNDNYDSIEDRRNLRDSSNYRNSMKNNNINNSNENYSSNNNSNQNNRKSNVDFNIGKNYEKDEFISVDKLHETPVFNKDNQNIYSNLKKEINTNDNNKIKNDNREFETSDFKYDNNKNKTNNSNNVDNDNNNYNQNNKDIQRSKEIEMLQSELEKIKNNHSQNAQINQKNHSRNNSKSNSNINIIDNYNTNHIQDQNNFNSNNNNKSNRDSDNNEFSVGNITSSYDWELESNRKDRKDENKVNSNTNNNNSLTSKLDNKYTNSANKNTLNASGGKSIKLKDLKDKPTPVSKNNSNPIENSIKKISSIKEESDEQEKENISSFDDNSKNKVSEVNANSEKKENYFNTIPNKLSFDTKSNNNNININSSNQVQKKSKLNISNNNSNQKTAGYNKSTSHMNNLTNKSNSYGDFDNTENLEGFNLKNSFNNKFSNVNFDLDQKEIEEEIKSENPSENYGDDFIEDVDNIDNKNHKISFDLDAIKNVSNNFTATNISYLVKDNAKNSSKSRDKDGNKNSNYYNNQKNSNVNNISSSTDIKYEKFYQSKNSNEDGGIEENISVNDSSKRDKNIHSAKSLTIDEDSYIRNNRDNNGVSNEYKYNFSENMIKSNIEDSNNNFNDYYASKDFAGSNTLKNIINSKNGDNSNREANNVQKLYDSRNSEIREDIVDEDDGYEPINYD